MFQIDEAPEEWTGARELTKIRGPETKIACTLAWT